MSGRHGRRRVRAPGVVTIVLALAWLPGACSIIGNQAPSPSPTTPGEPRAVAIDTDMAPDDWLAILYLLGRPDVSVRAITVTGTGEAHCGPGVRHALGLLSLAGRPEVPVACGRETPIAGDHAFPGAWRDRVDALLGLSLPENPNEPDPRTAPELLAETLRSSPRGVTVLSLGPLTNLAQLLRDDPGVGARIDALYVMGGALDVPGNVGVSGVGIDNPFAEWNIYVDPAAADVVLRSSVPVALVPLDATSQAPVTTAFVDTLAADAGTASARFTGEVLARLRDAIAAGSYYFWDPLAAAILTDEGLASFDARVIAVVIEEGPQSGRLVASPTGDEARFATWADRERFERVFLDALNGRTR